MFRTLSLASAAKQQRLERARLKFVRKKKVVEAPKKPAPVAADVACGCITKGNAIRSQLILLVTSQVFDRMVLIVILANCVTLAMFDPLATECTGTCVILTWLERGFSAFFFFEMVLKMVALGVCGQGSYLSTGWNRVDFIIVVASVLEYSLILASTLGAPDTVIDVGGLKALRSFRAMRPLRAVNRLPGVRVLVNLLLDTLPMLGSIAMLCGFIFLLFSIVGVQLWKGLLRKRCFHDTTGYYPTPPLILS